MTQSSIQRYIIGVIPATKSHDSWHMLHFFRISFVYKQEYWMLFKGGCLLNHSSRNLELRLISLIVFSLFYVVTILYIWAIFSRDEEIRLAFISTKFLWNSLDLIGIDFSRKFSVQVSNDHVRIQMIQFVAINWYYKTFSMFDIGSCLFLEFQLIFSCRWLIQNLSNEETMFVIYRFNQNKPNGV